MRDLALAVLCILGWVAFLAFSILRLLGVVAVSDNVAVATLLAVIPLALSLRWAVATVAARVAALPITGMALLLPAAPMAIIGSALDLFTRKDRLS